MKYYILTDNLLRIVCFKQTDLHGKITITDYSNGIFYSFTVLKKLETAKLFDKYIDDYEITNFTKENAYSRSKKKGIMTHFMDWG